MRLLSSIVGALFGLCLAVGATLYAAPHYDAMQGANFDGGAVSDSITIAAGKQLKLTVSNTPTTPAICFDAGDTCNTGAYPAATGDEIRWSFGGTYEWEWSGAKMSGSTANEPIILWEIMTATNPGFANRDDPATGLAVTTTAAHLVADGENIIAAYADEVDFQYAAATLGGSVTSVAVTAPIMGITDDGDGNVLATITGANAGAILRIICVSGAITLTDDDGGTANTPNVAGTATDYVMGPTDTVTLVNDGTSWYEMARSVN